MFARALPIPLFVVGSLVLAAACGAAPGHGDGYAEYECPAPIGPIVREDCSKSALRYDSVEFSGSVGVAGVAEGSATYKETALRQADRLVAMLKEQRVGMCNDFNTCKLTASEYRGEKARLDDSFVALAALQDRVAQMDAEGATKLLAELQSIRSRAGVSPGGATSDGSGVVSFGGHRYQRLSPAQSWHAARQECERQRAHLVTVESAEENAFVEQTFAKSSLIWLGATDEGHEGDFRWVPDAPLSFRSFADGEPNNSGGNEHYLHLGSWQSTDGQLYSRFGANWNDIAAEGKVGDRPATQGVCEWD